MNTLRTTLLALCAYAFAACGHGGDTESSSDAAPGTASAQASSAQAPSFLEGIASAPARVAYTATRRVYFEYPVGDALATLQYTERVVSNGQGRFAIDPLAIEHPKMTAGEQDLFELMQKNREGFFYRYRDFHIEDLPQFTRSYRLQDTGNEPTIAGRACVELEIHRNEPAPTWHRAAIDPATGLVLRCEEIGAGGRVLSRVEVLELVLEANPTVALHVDLAAGALDLGADTIAQIGFRVLVPKSVPAGFALRRTEQVEDEEGQRWARLVYGDGAAQIFLLHTETELPTNTGAVGPTAHDELDRNSVRVLQVGPWTVAQAFIGPHRLIAMGKLDVHVLLRMLDSAL